MAFTLNEADSLHQIDEHSQFVKLTFWNTNAWICLYICMFDSIYEQKWRMYYSDRLSCWPSDWLTNCPTNKDRYISRYPSLYWFWSIWIWSLIIQVEGKVLTNEYEIKGKDSNLCGPAFRTFDKRLMTVFNIFQYSDILSIF